MNLLKKIILKGQKIFFAPVLHRVTLNTYLISIARSLARAAATSSTREIDETDPISWEFSGFSQNGEDGIIDYLLKRSKSLNRYFVEIGASNGLTSNTAWLAHGKKFSGLMIDGDPVGLKIAHMVKPFGVEVMQMFVTPINVGEITEHIYTLEPDVFSLDIDGVDFYIMEALMEKNFKPKLMILEYNSAFGPSQSATVEYSSEFSIGKAHSTKLYYGVSIAGWRAFLAPKGYRFITVDSNGVNAVFAREDAFETEFLDKLNGLEFAENFYQLSKFKKPWDKQFELIKDMKFSKI